MKMILRIIVSPAVFLLLLIASIRWVIIGLFKFIKNGGEMAVFEDHDRSSIRTLLDELNKQKSSIPNEAE